MAVLAKAYHQDAVQLESNQLKPRSSIERFFGCSPKAARIWDIFGCSAIVSNSQGQRLLKLVSPEG